MEESKEKKIKIMKLANNLINNSIKLRAGENLLIEVSGKSGIQLAQEIEIQAKNIGAFVTINYINYDDLKEFLLNATEQQIKEYGKKDLAVMKCMQAYIGISSPSKENPIEGVPQNKLELYNKFYIKPVHLEQRVNHTKWCILRYPNEFLALKNKMTLPEFEEFFFNVCNLDYNKMSIAMDDLKDLMNKTDKVHILAPGTDITFSIKGIKAEKYYGTYNLPDGEVATCPVKNSVNGFITYNTKTKYNDIVFGNIRFEFKDGKIINAEAKGKTKELNAILDTDEGARYIGEFAFGLNPYINNTMCDTLFDEKIHGSFHLTPGMALEESDNGNRSAIHWDIVKILRKEFGGGKVYFDDVLVMEDGIFVLPDLDNLNPNKLI